MGKKTLQSFPVQGKKVLVRVDYNVPIKDGKITDDTRIVESGPTVRYLLEQKAAVILCAHLGRPKGTVNPKYSLKPVAARLQEIFKVPVSFASDCIGAPAQQEAAKLKPGQILLLENLRYHAEEEKNDPAFAKELASVAQCFVQDAFGAVHRAHASTVGVTKFLPSVAGFLLQKELTVLGKILKNPEKPFVAILGGAKVSDKIDVIRSLIAKTDRIVIGGGMSYTFLKAQGHTIGKSLLEADKIDFVKSLNGSGSKIALPVDHLVADKPEAGAKVQTTPGLDIADGWMGVDIGPKSIQQIESMILSAKTIFWNGPLGIFEVPEFSKGTVECAKMIAKATANGAFSVVGGGDSIAALNQSGVAKSISHISTGGGASLEFLEGKPLPGVEALPNA